MRRVAPLLAVLFSLAVAADAPAQAKEEPLVQKVKNSIDLGVRYLRGAQREDGSWEVAAFPAHVGGQTALTVLALLNCGLAADDPHVKKGLSYLRTLQPNTTYVRSLQTMALAQADPIVYKQLIQDNVQWLINAGVFKEKAFTGFSYTDRPSGTFDNSNTQFGVLGLWAGKQAGIKINREIWEQIRDYYIRGQSEDGGHRYAPRQPETLTMTTAGLCGLLVAGMELNSGREELLADGTAKNCGLYTENKYTAQALSWISSSKHFRVNSPGYVFYSLYGLERAGRLSGLRFFGQYDWYREGCQHLVGIQQADGHWASSAHADKGPVISTSFALLFLSKGRTPVLITKMVHGDWSPDPKGEKPPRNEFDLDWNNDRNDLRNLVDFTSKQVFKDLPLAWQTFDLMRAAVPQGNNQNLTDEDIAAVTSDMLQSPIFYITGHKSPLLRMTPLEKDLLKKYVENGGFIFAEACCGSAEFDRGFKALAAQLWPNNDLAYLDDKHMVWKSFFTVAPGKSSKLMGVSLGCKTVLIYSPQDLSCRWESNKLDNGAVEQAFRLGANVIAYATGLEPPRPRLTQTQVVAAKDVPGQAARGFFRVAQLKHGGDWQPAPNAMRNLMSDLNQKAGLDVILKTESINLLIDRERVIDAKFIYMHGRGQFSFDADKLADLRFNLKSGGLLFADACCGKEAFDKSFRAFMEQMFPNQKLEDVPLDDELYSKELNGVAITEDNIKGRTQLGKEPHRMPPALEGIKVNNRWVVLYSKYDIGCALERHQSSDCLGYNADSAFRLAGAAVLYTLRP